MSPYLYEISHDLKVREEWLLLTLDKLILMVVSTLTRALPPPQPEVLHDYWKISSLILKA